MYCVKGEILFYVNFACTCTFVVTYMKLNIYLKGRQFKIIKNTHTFWRRTFLKCAQTLPIIESLGMSDGLQMFNCLAQIS